MAESKSLTFSRARSELQKLADAGKAAFYPGFFKTGRSGYAEGDRFYGVTVPKSRVIARQFSDMPLPEIKKLLYSPIHEERLVALLILVKRFKKGDEKEKKDIYDFYLRHKKMVNNWDLVDLSAPYISGGWLLDKPKGILDKLAASKNLWDRRIAVISIFASIRANDFKPALKIIKAVLHDEHDLIHKASGWMLREIGKRAPEIHKDFLDLHAHEMPRTMLRYAIEKLPEKERQWYMKMKSKRKAAI
jgi:3-methyladenine DNA glycosylase AlkD